MSVTIIGVGFVGKAISDVLISKKQKHFCLDSKAFNLCYPDTWDSFPSTTKQVVIAAGEMSEDVDHLKKINEDPVRELCGFLDARNVGKIIFLSSGVVYGDYEEDRYTGLRCNPTTKYGISKLKTENLFISNWKKSLNILRLFFPYGPKQRSPRLVPTLIDRITQGLPVRINNDGGPIISMTHVEDVARCIVEDFICQDNPISIHNLSSSYKISIADLSRKISSYIGKKPIFEKSPQESSNCTSVPYDFNWQKTGDFQSLFL